MPEETTFSERLARLLGGGKNGTRLSSPRGVSAPDDGQYVTRLNAELARRRTATPALPPAVADSRVVTLPDYPRPAAGNDMPVDLSEVVQSWASLPAAVRASIVSIVRASKPL